MQEQACNIISTNTNQLLGRFHILLSITSDQTSNRGNWRKLNNLCNIHPKKWRSWRLHTNPLSDLKIQKNKKLSPFKWQSSVRTFKKVSNDSSLRSSSRRGRRSEIYPPRRRQLTLTENSRRWETANTVKYVKNGNLLIKKKSRFPKRGAKIKIQWSNRGKSRNADITYKLRRVKAKNI